MFLKAIQGSISHATIEQKAPKLVGQSKICCLFLIPVTPVIICQSLLLVGPSALSLHYASRPVSDASQSLAKVFPSRMGLKQTHLVRPSDSSGSVLWPLVFWFCSVKDSASYSSVSARQLSLAVAPDSFPACGA